jgi:hypothetical protein
MTLLEFLLLITVAGATGTGTAALVAALLGMIGREPVPVSMARRRQS